MDLTTRKNKFIERFMQLTNIKKLEELEDVLFSDSVHEEAVVYDINGEGITKKEYIKRNEEAVDSYKQGHYKTSDKLKEKYRLK